MCSFCRLCKSREIKINRTSCSSTDEEGPPDKLMNVSLAGSTSEFYVSSDNNFSTEISRDHSTRDSIFPENNNASSADFLSPSQRDNSVMEGFISESECNTDEREEIVVSASEYDTDEREEMEANLMENSKIRPDDVGNDIKQPEASSSLRERLREWANKNANNITRLALDELLKLLRDCVLKDLPKCAETLSGTKRTGDRIKNMKSKRGTNGSYMYTGIQSVLEEKILKESFEGKIFKLLVNIDDLPLYNKLLIQVWPILIQILLDDNNYYCTPFVAGMFCGDSKPASASDFLEDFVQNCIQLIEEGVQIGNTVYKVEFAAFVCDTPARAFIKCTKGHTGLYSCERCEIRGKTHNGKRIFPNTNCPKRTKASFAARKKTKRQQRHHQPNQWRNCVVAKPRIAGRPPPPRASEGLL